MQPSESCHALAASPDPFEISRKSLPPSRSLYEILAELGQRWTPVLFANFRRAGLPLPPWLDAESDLYRDAPDSVRREHSLHAIGPDQVDRWIELIEDLRGRDALVVIFTQIPRDELTDGLRLYRAWYAQPQSVRMVFDEGSEHLAKGLMTGVEAVLLETSAEEGWALYVRPGVELDLDQLLAAR